MRTYINATNLDLPVNSNAEYQNLFLDVDYQVENSEVAVKSVHFYGDHTTLDLPEDARLALAQQIRDSLVFAY